MLGTIYIRNLGKAPFLRGTNLDSFIVDKIFRAKSYGLLASAFGNSQIQNLLGLYTPRTSVRNPSRCCNGIKSGQHYVVPRLGVV